MLLVYCSHLKKLITWLLKLAFVFPMCPVLGLIYHCVDSGFLQLLLLAKYEFEINCAVKF